MKAVASKASQKTGPRKASKKAGKAMCSALANFAQNRTGPVAPCEFEVIDRHFRTRFNPKVKVKGRPISEKGRFKGPDRLAREVRLKDGRVAVTNRFSVRRGTILYDGKAEPLGFSIGRGTLKLGKVYINYGQRKKMRINGNLEEFVYVISAPTTNNQRGASGWIKVTDVVNYRRHLTPDKMPDLSHHQQKEFEFAPPCTITGGDPARYKNRKVRPCVTDTNIDARDYLKRTPDFANPLGYVNLLYNLPGRGSISADTLPVGTTFVPVENVEPVSIALYRPNSPKQVSERHPPNVMEFVYGYARTPNAVPPHRYGWIARAALNCS
jgi:hypothetical protein